MFKSCRIRLKSRETRLKFTWVSNKAKKEMVTVWQGSCVFQVFHLKTALVPLLPTEKWFTISLWGQQADITATVVTGRVRGRWTDEMRLEAERSRVVVTWVRLDSLYQEEPPDWWVITKIFHRCRSTVWEVTMMQSSVIISFLKMAFNFSLYIDYS